MAEALWAATRKGLVRFDADGADWRPRPADFLGDPVSAFLRDPRDGTLYAALRLGHFGVKLHRSDDDGATWTEIAAPAFPAAPEGGAAAPSVDMIWTLVAGGADQPGLLHAGVLPAALFVSRDRGESWALNEPLWARSEREKWMGGGYDAPGLHSILVDPRDSAKLTLGISCGGVWKSDDGGRSWRQGGHGLRAEFMPPDLAYDPVSQDPHRLAACAAAPDVIWCQHHNGIFRSTDGGDNFVEFSDVKPSVFGFAVAAHPADPASAWFAPGIKDERRVPVDGALVVTRTRDGGGSFSAHGAGLPARDSYDLIYRHALAVDGSGRRLAMGSTTGNLWTSADGGETWRHLSAHLAPIAQVCLA